MQNAKSCRRQLHPQPALKLATLDPMPILEMEHLDPGIKCHIDKVGQDDSGQPPDLILFKLPTGDMERHSAKGKDICTLALILKEKAHRNPKHRIQLIRVWLKLKLRGNNANIGRYQDAKAGNHLVQS